MAAEMTDKSFHAHHLSTLTLETHNVAKLYSRWKTTIWKSYLSVGAAFCLLESLNRSVALMTIILKKSFFYNFLCSQCCPPTMYTLTHTHSDCDAVMDVLYFFLINPVQFTCTQISCAPRRKFSLICLGEKS